MADQVPTVRYATQQDVPEILDLITQLAIYEKEPDAVEATVEKLTNTLSFPPFESSHGYAKTVLIFPAGAPSSPGSKAAGMAMYFNNYSTWRAAPGIYLEDLFVRTEFRGKGFGQRLLGELAAETKRIGGARLEWCVLKWNEPSLNVYLALGAKRQDDWVTMRTDGEALDKLAGRAKGLS